jgi:hypothetical protein
MTNLISNTSAKTVLINCTHNNKLIKKLYKLDIFIYCSGKCGGSTLNKTFEYNNFNTIHIHSNYYFQNGLIKNNNITIFDIINYNKKNNHIYIIDSYRTPIERKISSFFENIHLELPDYHKYSIDELIDIFNKNFFYNLENYHSMDEITEHYGFPIFSSFDFNNKYNIYIYDNITFIKIRFHEIKIWKDILSKIFNTDIKIINNNLTENKKINSIYNEFKHNYRVPDRYLDEDIINDKHFLIYNTEDEQKEYLKKWDEKRISKKENLNIPIQSNQLNPSNQLNQLNQLNPSNQLNQLKQKNLLYKKLLHKRFK